MSSVTILEQTLPHILGKSLAYASGIALIGLSINAKIVYFTTSISEQSYIVMREALRNFLILSGIWVFITSFTLYHYHGWKGLIVNLIVCGGITFWIWNSYRTTIEAIHGEIVLKPLAQPPKEPERTSVFTLEGID